MTSYLDKLNLKPFEKRMVVIVATVLFFVLNWWFVFPHFSDWNRVQFRMTKARRTLATFQREVSQTNTFARAVKQLESEGYSVAPEDQALHFNSTKEKIAAESGVIIGQTSRPSSRTNQFFLELWQNINVQTKEQQLVDFLYNLGASNSLIRVRDLSLRPDTPKMNLNANIRLAASYQKRPQPPAAKSRGATATSLGSDDGTKARRASVE